VNSSSRPVFLARHGWTLVLALLILVVSCEPPVKQPTGPARDYTDAEDLFKKGNFDRSLTYSEGVASASPSNAYTERARVLRIIIYGGRVKAYEELADAYGKGSEKTKNPTFKADYERLRNDSLQYASASALGLAEAAHRMMESGIGKEVVLEVPYPAAEGPVTVTQLSPVMQGAWIEPADQDAASRDAQSKGIDDELALAVGGDRAKARAELTAGPVKIPGWDFALFLGNELLNGATAFDHKHYRDYEKFKILTQQADDAAQAALTLLKDSPDKDKEKAAKKLQDDIKAAIKKNSQGLNYTAGPGSAPAGAPFLRARSKPGEARA
jgi:hypothetical protein